MRRNTPDRIYRGFVRWSVWPMLLVWLLLAASNGARAQTGVCSTTPVAWSGTELTSGQYNTNVTATTELCQDPEIVTHATDCPANATSSVQGSICIELDEMRIYVCEPTSGDCDTAAEWTLQSGEYSPDSYPTTCEDCEEWTNDTESLTWTDGNAGSLTRTIEMDGTTLEVGNESTQARGRWLDAPAGGTDFFMVAKLAIQSPEDTGPNCGIWMLIAGTEASPTDLELLRITNATTDLVWHSSKTSYSSSYTNHTSAPTASPWMQGASLWLAFDYDGTGDTAVSYASYNGRIWWQIASQSTAADPSDIGYYCDANGLGAGQIIEGHFEYFRVFTAGQGLTDFIIGGR